LFLAKKIHAFTRFLTDAGCHTKSSQICIVYNREKRRSMGREAEGYKIGVLIFTMGLEQVQVFDFNFIVGEGIETHRRG
jgi:hypothetical protein